MNYLIIDAHIHLWKKLSGHVKGYPVKSLGAGQGFFLGEVRQLMPPYMINGQNSAEMYIANMKYAGVAGAGCYSGVYGW